MFGARYLLIKKIYLASRLCLCSKIFTGIVNNGGLFGGAFLWEFFFLEKTFEGSFFLGGLWDAF